MNQTAANSALFRVTCTMSNSLTVNVILTPDVIYILELAVTLTIQKDDNDPNCPLYELCGHGALPCVSIYEFGLFITLHCSL